MGTASPLALTAHENRGQQQRQQKQQVIDAAPDVPDTGVQILMNAPPRARMIEFE